ncbi:MAG: c-type cytochrome, partial [Gammaproteobacteria bacterium]|nr:c-type cytochrome [Gammaproteobacteria bacterium]
MHTLPLSVLLVTLALAGAARAEAVTDGHVAFEQKCAACHTIGGGDRVGPDLHGVTQRRTAEWLLRFVMAPEAMIAAGDPVAVRLVERYNRIVMPNLGLGEDEARALLAYLASASAAPVAAPPAVPADRSWPVLAAPQSTILIAFLAVAAVIVAVFAWVALSTRSSAEIDVHRAYGLRKAFFATAAAALVALLVATLPRAPYAGVDARPDRVIYVAARQFDFVFSDEPILSTADLGQIPAISQLEVPAGSLVEFRVTSLDVNHGFG